jgi:glutamyl/glutaminyl-tRNA synthetase
MQLFRKTRIAPTPSGFLHLGNLYSFALTATLAEKHNASILLRIDDIDQRRAREEYVRDIFDTLAHLEIKWNEGPASFSELGAHSQVTRIKMYEAALHKLQALNMVYKCCCPRNRKVGDKGACSCKKKAVDESYPCCYRLDTSGAKEIIIKTYKHGVLQTEFPAEMNDFIVWRKEGIPSYQLTSVVDDAHFGVDLIVRGNDLWTSTLAQIYLSSVLGLGNLGQVTFHHHELIKTADGRKLSKSAGDGLITHNRNISGKDVHALLNALN